MKKKWGQTSWRERNIQIFNISVVKFSQTDYKRPYMCKWAKYETTHTCIWYLKRESSQSLRHSMRNKYLIGGWPTSCSLKSYLSFSASIHRRGLFPQALQQRERETLRWKEKTRESEEEEVEEMQGDKRVGEQSERWSGERIDVGLSFSPSEAETVRR